MLLDRPLLRGRFNVTFGYKKLENIYVETSQICYSIFIERIKINDEAEGVIHQMQL